MFKKAYTRLEFSENLRGKIRRCFDGGLSGFQRISYRKLFLIIFCFAILLLYVAPGIARWLFGSSNVAPQDQLSRCIDDRLTPFYLDNFEFNAHIRSNPSYLPEDLSMLPYVGNGIFSLEISDDAHLNIREGRALVLPVNFHPIVSLSSKNGQSRESTVVEYTKGIVNRFQCFTDGYFGSYMYYAHRNNPSVFVQEIQITNTKNQLVDVELTLPRISDWPTAVKQSVQLQHGSVMMEYEVITGYVTQINNQERIRAVSIVYRKVPRTLTLKKRGLTKLELLTTIQYSDSISKDEYAVQKDEVEKMAVEAMKKALQEAQHNEHSNTGFGGSDTGYYKFRQQHIKVWNKLWETGFYISKSKADNALNGDKVNATIYAVLSQVRAYEFEESITPLRKNEILKSLTYVESCYDSYHTLQAENLWREMKNLEDLNSLVSNWLLTLDKQGCHNLLKAGASGVIQAMVLSFGSFRFSNQHLELNIHPKFLHRDFGFRRLNYGNNSHVNVSVTVREDNKAEIEVSLDRSDRNYYACAGGCLDDPIQLSQMKRTFPVKLTEPLTAILYITYDKQHILDLKHAIHVKEVVEAPPHEHHVINLHKHGHNLGGLPTLFWVSICAIIVVFHVFLCKLIVKEYCEPSEKIRYRYSKP